MIIDRILDRKDGEPYEPREFYFYCLSCGRSGDTITRALDGDTETDIKKALCNYIINNNYKHEICNYINSVNWLN